MDDTLRTKLKAAGFAIPSSNWFFETPQSAYLLARDLSNALVRANTEEQYPELRVERSFWYKLTQFILSVLEYLFGDAEKPQITKPMSDGDRLDALQKDRVFLDKLYIEEKVTPKAYADMAKVLHSEIDTLEATVNQLDQRP